mmetsp:Transcript_44334/g.143863  ORF Transcript_44334/g.143863 Transcript_44334/m.143863 type:complete len:232 (+) Transcript_44334:995-1690(+)
MPRVADMPSRRETPRRGDAPKVWRKRDRETAIAAVELAEVGAVEPARRLNRPPQHGAAHLCVWLREGPFGLQVDALAAARHRQPLLHRLAPDHYLDLARPADDAHAQRLRQLPRRRLPRASADRPVVRDRDQRVARGGREEAHVVQLVAQLLARRQPLDQRAHQLVEPRRAHRVRPHLVRRARVSSVEHDVVQPRALSPDLEGSAHAKVRPSRLEHLDRGQLRRLRLGSRR